MEACEVSPHVLPNAHIAYHETANVPWEENEIAHEKWCNTLAVKFLCIFVLDRFGDFVSDQVRALI